MNKVSKSKEEFRKIVSKNLVTFIVILSAQVLVIQGSKNSLSVLSVQTLHNSLMSVEEISGLLRQEILEQFEVVSKDLKALSEKIGKNNSNENPVSERSAKPSYLPLLISSIRSLPIDESNMYAVEHSVLINFRSELQATLSGTNQAGSNNCPLNYNTDTCEELLKLVLCGYNHLKNGFELATRNSVAIDESRMWQNKLEDYKEKSTKLLDDKITSLSQKYNSQIDNLKTDLQSLQNKANLYVKIIEENVFKDCTYKIINGDIQGAVDNFKQLKGGLPREDVMIRSILRTVYSLDRFENIIHFLKKFPNCTQDRVSYPALYDIMKANGHLNSPELLVLSEALSQCMNPSDLATNVKAQVSSILDSWAYKVRNTDDYKEIIAFASKYYTQFRSNIDEFIQRAYSNNLSNVEKILTFIRDLPYTSHGIVSVESLYKRMKNNNHLDSCEFLMLAYRIKELSEMRDITNDVSIFDIHDHLALIELQMNIPDKVKRLIWNRRDCTLKNKAYNEYLYASNVASDSLRYFVFTWISTNGLNNQMNFEIDTKDKAETFSIKSNFNNRYMYPALDSKNDHRRWVYHTWQPGDVDFQGYWKLKPVENAKYFEIKSVHFKEFLYADGDMNEAHDSHRRGVYTWRHGTLHGVMEPEGQWAISC